MNALIIGCTALLFLISCKGEFVDRSPINEITFHEKQITLDCDTLIDNSGLIGNKIVCLQANGQIIVFDSSLLRDRQAEEKFQGKRFDALYFIRDTIFLRNGSTMYQMDSSWRPKRYLPNKEFLAGSLFRDSNYEVYTHSFGEFGGTIFFKDRKTGTLYSFPESIWPTQVIKHKDLYYVSENLGHMHGYSGLLIIKDPKSLVKIPDSFGHYINWSVTEAGGQLIKAQKNEASKGTNWGVTYLLQLGGKGIFCPLLFERDTSLFSVFLKDSLLLISRIDGMQFYPVKLVVRKEKNGGHFNSIDNFNLQKVALALYGSSYMTWDDTMGEMHSTSTILGLKNDSFIIAQKSWQRREQTEKMPGNRKDR